MLRYHVLVAATLTGAFLTLPVPSAAQPAPSSPRPSVECQSAKSDTEKTICGAKDLLQLDGQIGLSLAKARGFANEYLRGTLLEDQRDWMKRRNKCGADAACVRKSMQERLEELNEVVDTYERPREERHGPFLVRYVRGPKWDVVGPLLASSTTGPAFDGLAKTLRAGLDRGCVLPKGMKTTPADWTYSARTTVEFADATFFTIRIDSAADCGGEIVDAGSDVVTYAVGTGTRAGFSDFFTEALTLDKLIAWAEGHVAGFERPFGDCRTAVAGVKLLDAAIVSGGVLLSPALPHVDEDCDFNIKMPFDALAPYIKKTGPLATYRQAAR